MSQSSTVNETWIHYYSSEKLQFKPQNRCILGVNIKPLEKQVTGQMFRLDHKKGNFSTAQFSAVMIGIDNVRSRVREHFVDISYYTAQHTHFCIVSFTKWLKPNYLWVEENEFGNKKKIGFSADYTFLEWKMCNIVQT